MTNLLITLTGCSGAGKSTVQKRLDNSGVAVEVLSHTNRPKRGDDDRRIFVSTEEFQEMEKNGCFCQIVEYDGFKYGLERKKIEEVLNNAGQVPLLDVSEVGLRQILDADLADVVVSIFLTASPTQLRERLMQRQDPDPTAVRRRLMRTLAEVEGVSSGLFQVIIQNNDVDETVQKITQLIQGEEVVSDPFDLVRFKNEMQEVLRTLDMEGK